MHFWKRLAAAAVALSGGVASVSAEELSYAHYIPPTNSLYVDAIEPFFHRVGTATNGQLTFKAFMSGTMGGPKDLAAAVETGIVDSAGYVDAYIPAVLPYSSMLAMLSASAVDTLAFNAAMIEYRLLKCRQCQAEFDKINAMELALYSTATYHLMCREKVSTPEEAKGKKVRVIGQSLTQIVNRLGATPVSVSAKEIYEALQRGQVDCTTGPTSWLVDYNFGEFIKSIVTNPMGAYGSGGLLMMSRDVWEGLDAEQRQAMINELPQLVADANFSQLEEARAAQKDAVAKGAVLYEASDDFADAIKDVTDASWKGALIEAEARGIKDAREVVAGFAEVFKKWSGITASIAPGDKAAYAAALQREIYSHLPR